MSFVHSDATAPAPGGGAADGLRQGHALNTPLGANPRPAAPGQPLLSWRIQLTAIASLAVYLHSVCWWTEPRDMGLFIRPWFDHIVRSGPIGAFSHPFSNYAPAYLYLLATASLFHGMIGTMSIVKLLSVAGTAFAAYSVADLIKTSGGQPKYGVLVFVLPSAVINAALLAQCDALWAGACILAVSAMVGRRTVRSLVWCGVAIAFKAQATFIAPFIIGALIGRRAPLWQWMIPALVFFTTMVPAWLMGWPASDLLLVYGRQAGWFDWPGRLANPWIFATVFAPESAKDFYWIGFATVAAAATAIAALTSASRSNTRATLLLALLSSVALPFLFPKMLERYFFLADLLSLAVAISFRAPSTLLIAIAIQLASFLSLISYMYFYSWPYPTLFGTLLSTIALVMTIVVARRSGAQWPELRWRRRATAMVGA